MARKLIIVAFLFVALIAPIAALGHVSSATVNSKGRLLLDGAAASVSGTINCTPGENGSVSVILSQSHGKQSVFGSGFADASCTGSSTGWSVSVTALEEGTFKTGPAAARVDACSNDPVDFTHGDCEILNERVHLQR